MNIFKIMNRFADSTPTCYYGNGVVKSFYDDDANEMFTVDGLGRVRTFDNGNKLSKQFDIIPNNSSLRIASGIASVANGQRCAAVVHDSCDAISVIDKGERAGTEVQRMQQVDTDDINNVVSWNMLHSAGKRMLVSNGTLSTKVLDTRSNRDKVIHLWKGVLVCLPEQDTERLYAIAKKHLRGLGRHAYCMDVYDVRYNPDLMETSMSGNRVVANMTRTCLPGIPLALAGGGNSVLYHYCVKKRLEKTPSPDVDVANIILHGVRIYDMTQQVSNKREHFVELLFGKGDNGDRYIQADNQNAEVILRMGVSTIKDAPVADRKAVIVITKLNVYVYSMSAVISAMQEDTDGALVAPAAVHDISRSTSEEMLSAILAPEHIQMAFTHTPLRLTYLDKSLFEEEED